MTKRFLLALDIGDPDSVHRVMPVAEDMAEKFGAELHVLSVVPTYSMPIVGSFFPEGFEKKALETAKQALEDTINKNAQNPGVIKGHVVHGSIYEEIIRGAERLGCELIIMESHRPVLSDYLLGPNAARVVRHAKTSVYVHRS